MSGSELSAGDLLSTKSHQRRHAVLATNPVGNSTLPNPQCFCGFDLTAEVVNQSLVDVHCGSLCDFSYSGYEHSHLQAYEQANIKPGMDFKDRLKLARKHRKLNQTELAKLAGVDQATISNLERGKHRGSSHAIKIATALMINPRWLSEGYGEMIEEGQPPAGIVPVESAPIMKGQVPILSWVQAGPWAESASAVDLADVEYCPKPPGCSDQTFALRVVGESMIDEYPPGVLIFVDPSVEPLSGDDVVAVCEQHGSLEATFKRYITEPGSGPMLKALNSDWRDRYMELTRDCRVIGVVMAQMRIRRR